MSGLRTGSAGATRACPHCKAVILESASICPACRHHLRFDDSLDSLSALQKIVPLKVEGTVNHPANAMPWEYSAVVVIRNARGEEIDRHVVGVGAVRPGEQLTFSLAVEMFPHAGSAPPRGRRRLS